MWSQLYHQAESLHYTPSSYANEIIYITRSMGIALASGTGLAVRVVTGRMTTRERRRAEGGRLPTLWRCRDTQPISHTTILSQDMSRI